jgi:hypothetical protein
MFTDLIYRGAPWIALMLDRGPHAARLNLSGRHGVAAAAFLGAAAAFGTGRTRLAMPAAAGFLALNARFYALLLRRAGPRAAGAGLGLHLAHVMTSVAAAPLGALTFAMDRRHRSRGPRAPLPALEEAEPGASGQSRDRRDGSWRLKPVEKPAAG